VLKFFFGPGTGLVRETVKFIFSSAKSDLLLRGRWPEEVSEREARSHYQRLIPAITAEEARRSSGVLSRHSSDQASRDPLGHLPPSVRRILPSTITCTGSSSA
jgi:hypothetical protein